MKKLLFFTMAYVAITITACEKAEKQVRIDEPNLESIMQKVESGQTLSEKEEIFIEDYEDPTQITSRGDSIWLPTLGGSGSIIEFWPNYLQVNNHGALGFYFPPRDIKALITLKVTWTENGRQKSKKVHKIIQKMGDEYDIWSLYLNTIIYVDYGTKFKAVTKGINSKGTVKKYEEFGPWVYIPGFTANILNLNKGTKMPEKVRTEIQDLFFVK